MWNVKSSTARVDPWHRPPGMLSHKKGKSLRGQRGRASASGGLPCRRFAGAGTKRIERTYTMAALASTLERTDQAIRNDVLFELKYDPKMSSSSDVAVAVKEGVVTLS